MGEMADDALDRLADLWDEDEFDGFYDYHPPVTRKRSTCPVCKDKLVERRNKNTLEYFMGCVNYPLCLGTVPMRFYRSP